MRRRRSQEKKETKISKQMLDVVFIDDHQKDRNDPERRGRVYE